MHAYLHLTSTRRSFNSLEAEIAENWAMNVLQSALVHLCSAEMPA
jgi:hypothetical protein